MTAEEYYQNWIDEHSVDINGMASLTRNEVIAMIEGYHEQQVKSVDLADVGERSFMAVNKEGYKVLNGKAKNREDAIQKTYDQLGDIATTLEYVWVG